MPTYARVPEFAARKRYPRALAIIVAAHAAAIAAVMLVRMDLPAKLMPAPTKVDLIPLPKEPPPPAPPEPRQQPAPSVIDTPPAFVPVPLPDIAVVDSRALPLAVPEPRIQPGPRVVPTPPPIPALPRTGPRFATPDSALRPPYPASKIASGEEAVLRLKLSIDERGRVTAVEPVGGADPAFLKAARRHLTANWRYRPATEGGRPIASTTVITLQFQLDE